MQVGASSGAPRVPVRVVAYVRDLASSEPPDADCGLIRHSQRVPHEIQGIRPYFVAGQLGLCHKVRLGQVGNISAVLGDCPSNLPGAV